ncbi:MAG TPA: transglycosylase SLT domain-containing protein [Candidatus Limnocylindrales bacterium]|nr:transglycosylase SLT domain-containing protein [Candidatus Limnocylindrales bacterium]
MQGVLATAEKAVETHTFGIARKLLEAQGAIVGGFTTVSAGILGMVDKVAMADQGYRLMGMQMLMSTEQARKLDMVTKSLGASMEQIVWDPELRARAGEMSQHIDHMTEQLGPGFEKNMKSVRDFRQQFALLGIDAKFLGMQFASDLFDKLVPGKDRQEKLDKLTRWEQDFEGGLPQLSNTLSSAAIPVLKDTWSMLGATGEAAQAFGAAYSTAVGIISGDKSIEGATFSWEKFAGAMSKTEHALTAAVEWIAHAETGIAHFGMAGELVADNLIHKFTEMEKAAQNSGFFQKAEAVFGKVAASPMAQKYAAAVAVPTGKLGSAVQSVYDWLVPADARAEMREFQKSSPLLSTLVRGVSSSLLGGLFSSELLDAPSAEEQAKSRKIYGDYTAQMILGMVRGTGTSKRQQVDDVIAHPMVPPVSGPPLASPPPLPAPVAVPVPDHAAQVHSVAPHVARRAPTLTDIQRLIESSALTWSVDPALALAVAKAESGFDQNAVSPKGAIGIMQLMPKTASSLGVDPLNVLQNIDGGVRNLAELLKQYHGSIYAAIEAYNAGTKRVDNAHGDLSKLPPETQQYVPRVLQLMHEFEQLLAPPSGSATSRDVPPTPSAYLFGPKSLTSPVWLNTNFAPDWSHVVTPTLAKWEAAGGDPLSFMNRDWSAAIAQMDRPIAPQAPQVTHDERSITMGDVIVNVTQPGADAYTIAKLARQEIRDELDSRIKSNLAQVSPAY